jgi:hypothetical protein
MIVNLLYFFYIFSYTNDVRRIINKKYLSMDKLFFFCEKYVT